jgi:hypothetical protein
MPFVFTQLGADSGQRADENPLNPTNWLVPTTGQYAGFGMKIVSNQFVPTDVLGGMASWIGSAIPADQYCEIMTTQLDTFDSFPTLLCRQGTGTHFGPAYEFDWFGPFGASAGYTVAQISADGTAIDYDWYPSYRTWTINAGDVFRFAVVGGTGGSWYLWQNGILIDQHRLDDSPVSPILSGYTGMQSQGGGTGLKYFKTGSVTSPPHSPFFGMGLGR